MSVSGRRRRRYLLSLHDSHFTFPEGNSKPTANATLPLKSVLQQCYLVSIELVDLPILQTPIWQDDHKFSRCHLEAVCITLKAMYRALDDVAGNPFNSHDKDFLINVRSWPTVAYVSPSPSLIHHRFRRMADSHLVPKPHQPEFSMHSSQPEGPQFDLVFGLSRIRNPDRG
nr:hypothetical protein [uncultured Albidiferax sp.]